MHFIENKNTWILLKASLQFEPKGLVDDNTALVEMITKKHLN